MEHTKSSNALLNKMIAVINEVNCEVAERDEAVEAIVLAVLTKKNMFMLGATGQAKSYVITVFLKRITGSKQFSYLLTKQTDEEALFGRLDLKSYLDGDPKMITTGKIPDVNFAFLDETFKCNEGTLNSLLTALNERQYTSEGKTIDIPVISFMGASNEIPNFDNQEESILRPLFDRFEIKVVTEYIKNRDTRLRMLARKQSGQTGQVTTTITLEELQAMQNEAAAVTVPQKINELMDDILCELRSLGIHISDRKYFNYHPLAQAKAWLRGRNTVEPTDLSVLKYYLWTTPAEIPVIQKVLDKHCLTPLEVKVKEIISLADECCEDFDTNVDKNANSAIVKLRKELVQIYRMVGKLEAGTEGEAVIANAIEELEAISKQAHDRVGFAYAPLNLL